MIKLKNISQNDVILEDFGMQLLHPNEVLDLDGSRKTQATDSSQLIVLISNETIAVIDNDDVQVTDISLAIDIIKGFSKKTISTFDNKMMTQSTSRPIGTFVCFSSEGDSQNNPIEIGDGTKMKLHHQIGDPLEQDVYVDLNVIENKTFINEGFAIWDGCNFDELHFNVVPKLTPYIAGTGTYFNLYGGFLIIPAAGDGLIQVDPAQIQLVANPFSLDNPSQRQGAGFWDADYNTQTHQFENLRPNLEYTGEYNIFGAEINFETIVDIVLLSNGCISLRSQDVAEFGHGMRIKFTFTTNAPDHEWKCALNLTMNRTFTAENGD